MHGPQDHIQRQWPHRGWGREVFPPEYQVRGVRLINRESQLRVMTLITPGQTELTGAVWMETFAKLDVFIFTSFHFIPTAVIICSYLMTNSRSNFQPQFMYNLPAIISTNLMLIVKARSFPISFGSSYRDIICKKKKKVYSNIWNSIYDTFLHSLLMPFVAPV